MRSKGLGAILLPFGLLIGLWWFMQDGLPKLQGCSEICPMDCDMMASCYSEDGWYHLSGCAETGAFACVPYPEGGVAYTQRREEVRAKQAASDAEWAALPENIRREMNFRVNVLLVCFTVGLFDLMILMLIAENKSKHGGVNEAQA